MNKVISPFSHSQREQVIDYSFHYMPDYFDWAMPLPRSTPRWLAIFKPFTFETWICFIITTLGAGPVLAILVSFSTHKKNADKYGLQRSTLYIFSTLLDSSTATTRQLPQTRAPKIFISAWFVLW